jgi:branched-chain amino acid transport system substrate-binding protein
VRLPRTRHTGRALAALAFVVMIAVAIGIIIDLERPQSRFVVQAEVDTAGMKVQENEAAPADPAGDWKAICPPLSIGMAGTLTGPDSETGINIKNGVRLAIEKHNSANAGCQVQIKEFDTKGDPGLLGNLAPDIVRDVYTVGLVGPTFSGVAEATGAIFAASGLVAATASASRDSLSERGWKTFFRAVPSDVAQGRAAANYVKNNLQHRRVCVVDDGAAYGVALTNSAADTFGVLAVSACRLSMLLDSKQFDDAVDRIRGAAPDAVLYGGAAEHGAQLVRRLRDAGSSVAFIWAGGMLDNAFSSEARVAAKNALLSCPCGPAPRWFIDQYRALFGVAPGSYSAEGYDLATIMLKGIDGGMRTRPEMLEWMRHYEGQGVARRYRWTSTGELANPTVWIYAVR